MKERIASTARMVMKTPYPQTNTLRPSAAMPAAAETVPISAMPMLK